MASSATLPLELWLIIIDLAIDTSLIPDEICTYSNLARLNEHLRSPYTKPPIDYAWANLRLVCRAFKALTGPVPRLNMHAKGVKSSVRDVYIMRPRSGVACCMRSINKNPYNKKVIALTFKLSSTQRVRDTFFRSILQYGPSLPNLRKVTVTLNERVDWSTVWGNLNQAFPSLTCLIIYGSLTPYSAASVVADTVVFQQLKMLELDCVLPVLGVEFPVLRHVSLQRCSRVEMGVIKRWPHLESLLLRTMDRRVGFKWKHFPNLRLLGIPPNRLKIISRCPRGHPLSHLSIYANPPQSSPTYLVDAIMERLPSTTKIVLDLEFIPQPYLDYIVRGCALAGLELVGSPYSRTRKSALLIAGMVPPSVTDGVTCAAEVVGTLAKISAFIVCLPVVVVAWCLC